MGKSTFALQLDGRTILKLDKGHQELLFEIRPETFTPFPMGHWRWSYVELANLDEDELGKLLVEAWTQVVPKKVSKAYLAERNGSPPSRG